MQRLAEPSNYDWDTGDERSYKEVVNTTYITEDGEVVNVNDFNKNYTTVKTLKNELNRESPDGRTRYRTKTVLVRRTKQLKFEFPDY